MPRRKHLPLPVLLVLAFASAIVAGLFIQARRPDIGRKAVEEQMEARSPREKCDRLGQEWTFVTRTNPDVSLCYKTAWGWPRWDTTSIDRRFYNGKAYEVSFSQDGEPYISFESPDFELTGPTDAPHIPWTAIDITKPEAELRSQFNADEVRVFSVGSVPVVKVTVSGLDFEEQPFTEVRYFVVRPELHIRITVRPEQSEAIEMMLRASL